MLGVGGGCQQKTAGGAGEGHDEHASLVGAHLGPGGRDGPTALTCGLRAVTSCWQTVGNRVDEEAGASQGVPQAQVRPAVALQPGDHDELPLLARAARRCHDGNAPRAPPLGGDGVRGQDLGVELGQEAGRVLARVALGPNLRALEQGGDDVEIVLGGLGQQRAYGAAGGAQGDGPPCLGPAGRGPGGPQECLDITGCVVGCAAQAGAQGLDDPGGGEELARLSAEGLPVQGPGEGSGLTDVGQQGQEGGVGSGSSAGPGGGLGGRGGLGGLRRLSGLSSAIAAAHDGGALAQSAAQSAQVHRGQSHQGAGEQVDGGLPLRRFTAVPQLVADGGAHDVQERSRRGFRAQEYRGRAGGQGHAPSAQVPGQ